MSLKDRLPRFLPVFDPAKDISGFIDGFDDEADRLDADVADAEDSLQVQNASGQSLDLIGEDFGPFGQRRGRSDSQYREFLSAFLSSFDGRGTSKTSGLPPQPAPAVSRRTSRSARTSRRSNIAMNSLTGRRTRPVSRVGQPDLPTRRRSTCSTPFTTSRTPATSTLPII